VPEGGAGKVGKTEKTERGGEMIHDVDLQRFIIPRKEYERLRKAVWVWKLVALVELAMVFAMCWIVGHR